MVLLELLHRRIGRAVAEDLATTFYLAHDKLMDRAECRREILRDAQAMTAEFFASSVGERVLQRINPKCLLELREADQVPDGGWGAHKSRNIAVDTAYDELRDACKVFVQCKYKDVVWEILAPFSADYKAALVAGTATADQKECLGELMNKMSSRLDFSLIYLWRKSGETERSKLLAYVQKKYDAIKKRFERAPRGGQTSSRQQPREISGAFPIEEMSDQNTLWQSEHSLADLVRECIAENRDKFTAQELEFMGHWLEGGESKFNIIAKLMGDVSPAYITKLRKTVMEKIIDLLDNP